MITINNLISLGVSSSLANKYCVALVDTMDKYNINTPLRIQHFLAQILHESGHLIYNKEIASGKEYEGRKDLGNVHQGDGVKFKGRGFIQITGEDNYAVLSHVFGQDFLTHPELLEQSPMCAITAGWFWDNKHLNIFADKDDCLTITKRINGGTNGLVNRQAILAKCKQIIV